MSTSTPNPELLYSQYLAQRKNPVGRSHRQAWQVPIDKDNPLNAEPSEAYRVYRRMRSESGESAIDAIMELIKRERDARDRARGTDSQLEGDPHDSARGVDEQFESINDQQGASRNTQKRYSTEFILQHIASRLNKLFTGLGRGIFVPAVTALVVVMLTIPYFTNRNTSDTGLPVSLSQHASVAATLLETGNAESFGFADSSSEAATHFNKGSAFTSITIAALGRDVPAYESNSQSLLTLLGDSAPGEISATLDELRTAVTGVSDGTEQMDQILQKVDPLRAQLTRAADGAATQWFDLGQSVQSISVAAQLRLQSAIAAPLNDTLQRFRSLDLPEEQLPASKLIRELKQLAAVPSPDMAEVRQIATLCRDIRVLMQ